jgi:hypothetical protein
VLVVIFTAIHCRSAQLFDRKNNNIVEEHLDMDRLWLDPQTNGDRTFRRRG